MRQFLKFFLASLLALIIFTCIAFFIGVSWVAGLAARFNDNTEVTGSKAVLYIDLDEAIREQPQDNPLNTFNSDDKFEMPGLYDLVRLIRYAKTDTAVKGIYLKCAGNPNGFGTSEELRNALTDFKTGKKFIYAYADAISQKAYYVANVADKVYCHPKGGLEWKGFALQYVFIKQTLDRLGIEPQIFYAGKFKSATEPLRATEMTPANRLQSSVFLSDIYNRFLLATSETRKIDTATLHRLAETMAIQTTADAVNQHLLDGARYDDEVKAELRDKLGLKEKNKINFVVPGKYARAVSYKNSTADEKIALIYAQGDIVDGKGDRGQIGGDTYRALIRTARQDESIKAIVIRVNSGGGSAMASENMWREISLARKEKPVILSFGDYAASGGYYMSCGADSIFTQPNTLTGSIGVFSVVPNLKKFFNDKLGVTFDGVKTSQYADMPTSARPMTDPEKKFMQNDVDTIYQTFLQRVSDGRHINVALVDSIGQGRVWTGTRGIELGLADRIGGIQDAIDCAARMAKLKTYRLKEYPEPLSWWENLFGGYKKNMETKAMREKLGEQGYDIFNQLMLLKASAGNAQAKMIFYPDIQ